MSRGSKRLNVEYLENKETNAYKIKNLESSMCACREYLCNACDDLSSLFHLYLVFLIAYSKYFSRAFKSA